MILAAQSGPKPQMNARTRHHAPSAARRRGDTHDGHGARRPSLDAVIVGGGPAGLSAALVLGRARQRVLVVDTGRPANAASQGIGGLLAQTVAPSDLRQAGRDQLAAFANVEVRDGEVLDAAQSADGFDVKTDSGAVRTRALVLAHGLRYDPPPLPGVKSLWGRSVFHCPFCDGWEVRDLSLAVHGSGPEAARSALVVSGWSQDVVLLTDGPARLNGEREVLERAGVRVREERVREVVGGDGWLHRIEFESGPPEYRDAMFVRTHRGQPNDIADALGGSLTAGGTVVTDSGGRTGVPGLYAAGDAATESMRSVANALGGGSRVAQAVALDAVTQLA
jgi:thioredoxin reductase